MKGRTAIVTGGTGALGHSVVKHLLDAQLNVAIPYHSSEGLTQFLNNLEGNQDRLLLVQTNLLVEREVDDFVAAVLARFGPIQYLANTVGGYGGGKVIADVSTEEWNSLIGLNLTTAFLICRAVLREMRRSGVGRIVNIAAMAALSPTAFKGPYAISKRAVITLTESIAEETKGSGITANAIAPSIILSEANRKSMPGADHTSWVSPDEIARLILYLFSDDAKSISGNVIKVYGGV